MIKTIDNFEAVIDFAWELSQNDLFASYPKIKHAKELKEEILKAISEENKNIIACYNQGILCGVCIYFWDCDTKYAQTTEFLIQENYEQIADEFIHYLTAQLDGYELFIGVPYTNHNAIQYFQKKNIECIEASIDTRLYNLHSQETQKDNHIEMISDINFEEYGTFHDKYALPLQMYYDSHKLKIDIEHFRILVFKLDNQIRGSIFVKRFKDMAEVFGLFIDTEYKNKNIEELNAALYEGFEIKDNYRCFKFKL